MSYVDYINTILKPKPDTSMPLVLDLFSGAGGLSLGFEAVGFQTIGFEMNDYAANTYNKNLLGKCYRKTLEINEEYPKADIIIGGPPCQPFSVRGKQLGLSDSRDGFPIFLSAVRQLQPEICMFENVRGMVYKNKPYLEEILAELKKLDYKVYFELLNAKHYEVPQNRERVVVVASKNDFKFPEPKKVKFTAGDAVKDLIHKPFDKSMLLTPSMDAYIKKYEIASKCITPRDLHMDRPARTVTVRNLAGATSDMHRIRLSDGNRRMLSVREAARLQSFPDWFVFTGPKSEQFKQIGNAVAPLFSYHLASKISLYFQGNITISGPKYTEQLEVFN